ncbi:ABC transporter ATP-binding protein [Pararhizobium mangrovi]|uniref:sn-glycerol-3-phosphate ABC transporter ATP-binding protein UgpC n=1 Tax=Pararhizobium mangrovi TaxID=2590452 RepID=A0A506U220_9HYPH|nr:sn-glycerol-3-phosphate ABC transporter ATP-binding protein UgpC [Pararhizobium mangrovi]TPW28413.1 sn-glycerol-3-phosphate ABC transporter ATP-binding protein UgpC [Pararhizobium mangrovi]
MATVSFCDLRKSFGAIEAVKGLDLEVADREFVVLVGPSGCGKSTTLRMLAGLEGISGGEIRIGDTVVNALPPRARDIAMVFQDYALYPHKTVYDNMAFSLRVRGIAKPEIESRIREAATMLDIDKLLERKPAQLSGGQRQRVAMGRAIVRRPKVFLFDEPLSNLDAKLRGQVRAEIKKLHQMIGTTIIYVTHDQVEAMTLADRIVILRGGVIEQVGTPDEVYDTPASLFVGGFVGSPAMNFVRAKRDGEELVLDGGERMAVCDLGPRAERVGQEIVLGIRPEHFVSSGDAPARLTGTVNLVEPLGADTLVHLDVEGATVTARVTPHFRPAVGERLPLGFDPARIHLFDPDSEKAVA